MLNGSMRIVVALVASLLLFSLDASARPRKTVATHPVSERTRPSSGAERRQTLRNTGAHVKGRFRAIFHQHHPAR